MSKVISIFNESDKLEGSKNYKVWSRHIQSTLIYNELWKGVCNAQPTKSTNLDQLSKWELKDEKALALIHSIVSDDIFVHIENSSSAWKTLKDLFDSQSEALSNYFLEAICGSRPCPYSSLLHGVWCFLQYFVHGDSC